MFARAGRYIGWVGHQNLGDEAMWEACRARFPRIHWSVFQQAAPDFSLRRITGKESPNGRPLIRRVAAELRHHRHSRLLANRILHRAVVRLRGEVGLLGGGTLINLSTAWLNAYKRVRQHTKALVPVFGVGVASPEFFSLEPGWTDRRREWVSLLNELPLVGVRGPLSKALLEEAGASNVVVSGDPAVRFHVGLAQTRHIALADRPLRIGINCGNSPSAMWGSPVSLHDALADVAYELSRLGHEVQLLAVWPHDIEWCYQVARRARLPQSAVVPPLTSARGFLTKAKSLDLFVALKVHAAVLSGATNVPLVVLEYHPKCLDFAASIGWQRFAIRTSEVTAEKVLGMLSDMMGQLPSLRAELCSGMCKLAAQFDEYCRAIEPLLMHRGAVPC